MTSFRSFCQDTQAHTWANICSEKQQQLKKCKRLCQPFSIPLIGRFPWKPHRKKKHSSGTKITPVRKAVTEQFQDCPSDDFNFAGTQTAPREMLWAAKSLKTQQLSEEQRQWPKASPLTCVRPDFKQQLSMCGFAASRKDGQESGAHEDVREGSWRGIQPPELPWSQLWQCLWILAKGRCSFLLSSQQDANPWSKRVSSY